MEMRVPSASPSCLAFSGRLVELLRDRTAAHRRQVRVGLIGLGRISRSHIAGYLAIPQAARVVAVSDLNEETLIATADRLEARPYRDYRGLLEDAEVDAVDLMLPHSLHHEVACAALEAGRDVLVEKPMCPRTEECDDLIRRAQALHRRLGVAESARFVAGYEHLERCLVGGTLGEIRFVRMCISGSEVVRLRDKGSWKGRKSGAVGGAILDAGPHSFYLLKWLFGGVRSVRASEARLVGGSEVEDYAIIGGELSSGAIFSCEITFTAEQPWNERVEVYGSKATITVDQLRQPPVVTHRGQQDFTGLAAADVTYDPEGWKRAAVSACVRDFVAALQDDRQPSVSVEDARYSVLVAEMAYDSVAHGGVTVAVTP